MTEPGTVLFEAAARTAGDLVEVSLRATIPDGTHIESHEPPEPFLIPTTVAVEGLADTEVRYPDPVRKDLGLSEVVLSVYEGAVDFVIRGRLLREIDAVRGTVRYQPCVQGACLPPRVAAWEAALYSSPAK